MRETTRMLATLLAALCVGAAELKGQDMADATQTTGDGLPLPAGAQRVFSEGFNAGGSLTDRWDVISGNWTIRDGALYGDNSAVIALKQDLGSNLRVEYTAWSDDPTPCDLNVFFGATRGKEGGRTGSFFQFGGWMNSCNSIQFNGQALLRQEGGAFRQGIVRGRKHRIVAQKSGNRLVLFVDGKELMGANVFDLGAGTSAGRAGFSIYTTGFIADVTIYALPERVNTRAEDVPATVAELFDFEKDALGQKPARLDITGAEGAATVIDEPTWVYQPETEKVVGDKCLSIVAGDRPMEITVPFMPLVSGVIELDAQVTAPGQEGLKISPISADAKEVGTVGVDRDGIWYVTDRNGTTKFDQRVHLVNRGVAVPLRFITGCWHTLRIGFDAAAGTFTTGYNLFTTPGAQDSDSRLAGVGNYLYCDPRAMTAPVKDVRALRITVLPGAAVRLDNLGIVGPVGLRQVNGKEYWDRPLRDVMGWTFPPRKDPFDLKLHTVRNLHEMLSGNREQWTASQKAALGGNPRIYDRFNVYAATRYNELLIRQAFATEQKQMLERTTFHLKAGGWLSDELAGQVADAARIERETIQWLGELYRVYADAYINDRDIPRLMKTFPPAEEKLSAALDRLEGQVKACLDRLPKEAVAGKAPPSPCPMPLPALSELNYTWRDGQFWRDHEPDFVFLYGDTVYWNVPRFEPTAESVFNKTRRAQPPPGVTLYGLDPNDKPGMQGRQFFSKRSLPKAEPPRACRVSINSYLGGTDERVPQWWLDEHRSDPDVLMRNVRGAYAGSDGKARAMLNFWNPDARQLIRDTSESVAQWLHTNNTQVLFYEIGQESCNYTSSGYNESARAAFREHLKREYKTIAELNRTWGSRYASFDAIQPPITENPPSGLHYEFQRFRHQGLKDRVLLAGDAFRKVIPDTPLCVDFQVPLGGDKTWGFDMPALFDACDIVSFHLYDNGSDRGVRADHMSNRWLDSLRKARGNTIGNLEFPNNMNCPDLHDEDIIKNNMLEQTFHQMMWGQGLPSYWALIASSWSEGGSVNDDRLGFLVQRYFASYAAVHIDRARRFGRVALKAPTVAPDVAVLEATSSWYNETCDRVRSGMRAAGLELENAGYNYGFLYEQLLADGRQSLTGLQTVILPAGYCLSGGLSDALLAWVKSGGMLICHGAPGVYDSYGRPDGRLLDSVFPKVSWRNDTDGWRPGGAGAPQALVADIGGGLYQGGLGKGRVLVFGSEAVTPATARKTIELVAEHTQRGVWCAGNKFSLAVRADKANTYVYALNASLTQTVEDEICLRGQYDRAEDDGLQKPVNVPLRRRNDTTAFALRLAPAEGTLIVLSPAGIKP